MDIDKLKEWLEVAQKYQTGDFWNNVFEQETTKKAVSDVVEEDLKRKKVQEFPAVDIYYVQTHVVVLVELPGFDKNDVKVTVSGRKLLVKGVSKLGFIPTKMIQNERLYGEIERSIDLPETPDPSSIRVSLEKGLLLLTYTIKQEVEQSITIG